MKHKRLKTLLLLLIAAGLTGIQAQEMFVNETNGTKTTYVLDDIQKMSFADGNLTVDKKDNSSTVYALSDLQYIDFTKPVVNINEMENAGNNSLNIYPNPANNLLHIEVKDGMGSTGTISIINLQGKVIETVQNDSNGLVSIDISHLSKGIYICRHTNSKGTKTIKFIKQ
jgi:hypothetical protein